MDIYQLKIQLRDSKPTIWRRVLMPSGMTLDDLHGVIQAVMPWTDSHLHQFEIGRQYYSSPSERYGGRIDDTKSSRIALSKLGLTLKSTFHYMYDFGDSWDHVITLEKIFAADAGQQYPVCTKAVMACPPDDCGGVWGYYNLLDTLADPKHAEYKSMRDWMGLKKGDIFDPTAVDLDGLNEGLLPLQRKYGKKAA